VEIAALALVGYSFPAGFDGNSFVGIWSGSPTSATTQPLYDDFKVLDLP
jgi:hypothetical protein